MRIIDGKIMCCGTPFSGKHDISENRLYPVKGIAFITRGEKNSIMPIPPSVSLPLFMEQTVRSFGMARADRFLALLSEILTRVPVHSLTCNMDPEAAHVALKGMQYINEKKISPPREVQSTVGRSSSVYCIAVSSSLLGSFVNIINLK